MTMKMNIMELLISAGMACGTLALLVFGTLALLTSNPLLGLPIIMMLGVLANADCEE